MLPLLATLLQLTDVCPLGCDTSATRGQHYIAIISGGFKNMRRGEKGEGRGEKRGGVSRSDLIPEFPLTLWVASRRFRQTLHGLKTQPTSFGGRRPRVEP